MQRQRMIAALALFVMVSLLLSLSAGAVAQGQGQKKLVTLNPANMDTMYHTYVVTGKSGDSVTFNVLNSVVKNKDGSILAKDLTPPTPVQYFYANDKLTFGAQNRMTLGELRDTQGRITIRPQLMSPTHPGLWLRST